MPVQVTPYVPRSITVHLGAPDSWAENVTVSFPDYVKNVACSEIYPTWEPAAIQANVLAIISFALNRVYTEFYPSRGYDFQITSSTAYDQKFIRDRNIFENISRVVDEIFNDYIRRTGFMEPLAAKFCNGTTSTCAGLSQWGSQELAQQGYGAMEILRYYYGDNIELVRDAPVQRDPIGFGAYVSMFPQLIAGPIVKYKDVAEQLGCRRESLEKFASGVGVFIIGLGKKLLLANQMGLLWEELSCSGGTASAWVGMLAYTLQIYFDFSGYSDMAIGLGRMLGFEFLKNFDYPYISRSVTEFWRRWHISLSTWFREYVYIPLGGNRRGLKRQLLNIFIVWALTGLWHGASWNFVLWGLYYALWLTAEKVFLLRALEKLPSALRCMGVLLVVALGWMLFYFTDTGELFAFLTRLFSFSAEDVYSRNMILAYLPTLALAVFAATPAGKSLYLRLREGRVKDALSILGLGAVFLLCTAALASQSYNPFIYFRF